MAYTKQTWVDRVVQYARRYTKTDIDSNTVELVPEPGTVTAEGTAITASRMNNAENEIEFLSNRHATTSNAGNAYTLTITNSKYNYDVGHTIVFTANATNTGGATLNVNSKGAKTFKKEIEGSLIDLFYGDIASGRIYEAIYDGTYFILKQPSRRDEFYQASSVGTDAYAVSLSNEMIYNFSVYNGLTVRMKADVSNTGTATLAVNGAAAKTIKKGTKNNGLVDLDNNDIIADGLYTLIYDGTYFQLQNPTFQTSIIFGTYNGDGTSNRQISTGNYIPKYVQITKTNSNVLGYSNFPGVYTDNTGVGSWTNYNFYHPYIDLVNKYFSVSGDVSSGYMNSTGYTYYWMAWV